MLSRKDEILKQAEAQMMAGEISKEQYEVCSYRPTIWSNSLAH